MITLDDLHRLPPSPERDELIRRELNERYGMALRSASEADLVAACVREVASEQLANIAPDAPAEVARRRQELIEATGKRTQEAA